MSAIVKRAALFALYQLSLLLGVVLLPVALLARKVGVRAPSGIGALVEWLGDAYSATR